MLRVCSFNKLPHLHSSKLTNIYLCNNRVCSFHCSAVRLDSQAIFEKHQVKTIVYSEMMNETTEAKKLLLDNIQNFLQGVPSYISKSEQVHFYELMFGVCDALLRTDLSRESVELFCQFCDKSPLEFQQRFFIAYCTMLEEKTTFYKIQELLQELQPFIDKFDILHQHHSGALLHKHLAFYYIAKREYGKAKEELKDVEYSSFSELLEFFYNKHP